MISPLSHRNEYGGKPQREESANTVVVSISKIPSVILKSIYKVSNSSQPFITSVVLIIYVPGQRFTTVESVETMLPKSSIHSNVKLFAVDKLDTLTLEIWLESM